MAAYPNERKFSLEFKFRSFADWKLTKFQFLSLFNVYKFISMTAHITEVQKSQYSNI